MRTLHGGKTEGRQHPMRVGVLFCLENAKRDSRPRLDGRRRAAVRFFVLTNNPMVLDECASEADIVFDPVSIRGIFEEAASYVSQGHRLLTHPLSGSVKPGETPYKSMLVASEVSSEMDFASARLASEALFACDKFADKTSLYDERTLHDLQLVDFSLIQGALRSARNESS